MPKPIPLSPLAVGVIATGALALGLVVGSSFHGGSTAPNGEAKPEHPVAANAPATTSITTGFGNAERRTEAPEGSALAELHAAGQGMSEFSRERRGIMATSRLTLQEIPQALAFADTLGPEERKMITMGALARWAELDPRGAAEWTRQQMRRRPDVAQMLGTEVAEWTAQNPQAARAWVDSLKSGDERAKALGGYFRALGATDPAQGLQQLAALSTTDQNSARESLYRAWAARDPNAAVQQALGSDDPATRNNLLKAIYPVWAQASPQEAIRSAMELDRQYAKQPGGSPVLVGTLMNDWSKRDPAAALAQLIVLPTDVRDSVAQGVFALAAQTDPELARAFAAQLPPGRAADVAQSAIIASEAQQDAPKAAAAAAALPAGPEQQRAVEAVGYAWARNDPAAAASWLVQQPEGAGKTNAARNLVFMWGSRDPQAVGNWVATLPPGPSYDAAAGAFAWRAAQSDGPTGMEWAASVGDPKQREQITQQVLDGWFRRDPDSARAWLQTTNLVSSDLRAYLLRTK